MGPGRRAPVATGREPGMTFNLFGILAIALPVIGAVLILFGGRAAWRLLGAGLVAIGLAMLYVIAQVVVFV
jgi:hypothetical protein